MRRAVLVVWLLAVVAVGGVAWWYLFSAGSTPEGQKPLGDEAAFRQAFQAGVGKPRVVAVLSPTTPADLAVAERLQALLMEYENDALEAHVIWQPMARTDWAPTTDAMARVWDKRARHYWVTGAGLRGDLGAGAAFVFARGAGLDKAGVRVGDWQAELAKIREFLGPATRKTSM